MTTILLCIALMVAGSPLGLDATVPTFINQPAGLGGEDCSISRGRIGVSFPPQGTALGDGLFTFKVEDAKRRILDEVLLPVSAHAGVTNGITYTPIDSAVLRHAASVTCAFRSSDGSRDVRVGPRDCGNAEEPTVADQGYVGDIVSAEIVGTTVRIAYVVDWYSRDAIDVGAFDGEKVLARVDGVSAVATLKGRAPLSGVITVHLGRSAPHEIALGGVADGVFYTSRICLE